VIHHGSESYFVLGEGLLGESLGGRPPAIAAPVGAAPAIAAAVAAAPPFRFSRLGPKGTGKQLDEATRTALAEAITVDNLSAGQVPAGFTYLGQFIDHDLTFDKSPLMEGTVSPAELEQNRSPSLDLDSLYGAGPQDPGSARFYSDGLHLKVGSADGGPPSAGFDLPRTGTGTLAQKRAALIPDPRNDENLAVAQIHLAMIRFHNRVVDTLPASVPAAQRFDQARKKVTKHYQWMILHDFLPRICQKAIVDDVFTNGRKAFEVGASAMAVPTMPIEFSVAAYRLGHSMVRHKYSWNVNFPDATLGQLFDFSGLSGDLGGGTRLPNIWIADFRRLFKFEQADLVVPGAKLNKAMRIDTKLVNPLRHLRVPDPNPRKNLAFRNLTRANMVTLATGQQMATFLKNKGVALTTLTAAQVRDGLNGANLAGLSQAQRTAVVANTPLWFYILREAELNNGKLNGVGARIVAETFHRAMQGSKFSIVRNTAFKPNLGPNKPNFAMTDLLFVAFRGKANLLNPLGD